MNKEIIDKWLDEEYGVSYTRLEELHDWLLDRCQKIEQENKKLKAELELRIDNNNYLSEKLEDIEKYVLELKQNAPDEKALDKILEIIRRTE